MCGSLIFEHFELIGAQGTPALARCPELDDCKTIEGRKGALSPRAFSIRRRLWRETARAGDILRLRGSHNDALVPSHAPGCVQGEAHS